jgi:bifunctional N-acetylglucosamine-1-phosphate-uridyltransferase/glucosamine-1-phosphate-acetyltransferase GlmU-like protein
MSGRGQRFVDAGYQVPKPLLEYNGIPIIKHIVDLFEGEDKFTFICNSQHLRETNLGSVLKKIAPSGKVVEIERHKQGPVYTVWKIFDQINDDEEVIVHYCDVSKYWKYKEFLKFVRSRKSDGALSAHIGFHPHMLRGTNYALIKAKEQDFIELVEKKPLEDIDKEYVSDGLYYFRTGKIMKDYFKKTMDDKIKVNGEYYASVVYNLMKKDGLKVSVFESEHLMSAQNPLDYEDYQKWSATFKGLASRKSKIKPQENSINLIPLAGRGSRFAKEGYETPKPLIEVSGKPMIIQASESLPRSKKKIFVCLGEHLDKFSLEKELKKNYPRSKIVRLDQVTEGQACTCELGLKDVDPEAPLLIGACDNGMIWDEKKYQELLDDKSIDAITWTFRHDITSVLNPNAYAWLKVDRYDNVQGISVKKAISENPYNDHAFIGTMYFRKAQYFLDALKDLYENDLRVNGEFYLDSTVNSLIRRGKRVRVFEVESYIGWGTPNDLKTFEYWQSYFHKQKDHPYSIEKDHLVDKAKAKKLIKKATDSKQRCK